MGLNLSDFHAECKDSKTLPFPPIFLQNFTQKVINTLCGYLQRHSGRFGTPARPIRKSENTEGGIAKTSFDGAKCNVPHIVKWGILRFGAYMGVFDIPISGKRINFVFDITLRVMRKLFGICRNILAVVGGIAILLVVFYFCAKPYFEVDVYPSRLAKMDSYLDSLRTAGPYAQDTASFSIRIIQDTVRAKEIRDYFQLDTLFAPDADTWTKALAIGKFVASNIPHDNPRTWPEHFNAIGLWEYTTNVSPALNCRMHSIVAFELFLAAGLDAKYITCLPQDSNDNDCHVVNEVWLPELGKWAMIDTDFGGHYFSDLNGTPLSLKEMREHYISGEKMMYYPAFGKGKTKRNWYYAYWAKNTYWFCCWDELSYYQEDYQVRQVEWDRCVLLVPSGFEPFSYEGSTITTDADRFWAPPVH